MRQYDYYEFMGYGSEALLQRYRPYSERFSEGPVLDVACGRGEFLQLLRERRLEARGIDADQSMVEEARRRGASAELADGTAYLRAHPDEFGGVFAAHLIEHLAPELVLELVRASADALRPGGRLILVTPNPSNLQMQLHDFWIDLQHVRLYSPEIVRWILHLGGFTEIESGENELYRSGPDLSEHELPSLPTPRPARRRLGRELLAAALPPSLDDRLTQLERRVNHLTGWAASLYPAAEYFVTGVR
jgi:SAM-dependent methyltransferase